MSDYVLNENGLYLPSDYKVFEHPNILDISNRQMEQYQYWTDFVNWGRRNPVLFAERIFGVEFMDYQRYVFMMSWNTPYVVWCCSRGSGKALDLDTRIPTPDGDRTMRDIQIGDYVYDENGNPTRVINTSPIFKNHDCYEIEFSDGEKIVADADHLWEVKLRGGKTKIINTSEMYEDFLFPKRKNSKTWNDNWKEYRYAVRMADPLYKKEKEFPIDPYILGIWLGDGSSYHGNITSSKDDYEDMKKCIESRGYKVYSVTNDSCGNKRLTIHTGDNIPLKILLREHNLLNNKHIPKEYLEGSIEQRVDLLAGLLDTDGHISNKRPNECEFSQCIKHEQIVYGASSLLSSLGIKHKVKKTVKKSGGKIFPTLRIAFRLNNKYDYFRIPRKKKLISDYNYSPSWQKSIVNVLKVQSRPTKCIMVDSPSHLYLCGEKNTVTHNSILGSIFIMTKTLLIPNHTSYILCGVGSQSIELFTKIEKFVKNQIPSFKTLTNIYQSELVKSANSDGFVHNPASYRFGLYNSSQVFTLNGNFDANRSEYIIDYHIKIKS